ncbi:hypothetical protein X801_00391, partial [Opisthorchis viverrini]
MLSAQAENVHQQLPDHRQCPSNKTDNSPREATAVQIFIRKLTTALYMDSHILRVDSSPEAVTQNNEYETSSNMHAKDEIERPSLLTVLTDHKLFR